MFIFDDESNGHNFNPLTTHIHGDIQIVVRSPPHLESPQYSGATALPFQSQILHVLWQHPPPQILSLSGALIPQI